MQIDKNAIKEILSDQTISDEEVLAIHAFLQAVIDDRVPADYTSKLFTRVVNKFSLSQLYRLLIVAAGGGINLGIFGNFQQDAAVAMRLLGLIERLPPNPRFAVLTALEWDTSNNIAMFVAIHHDAIVIMRLLRLLGRLNSERCFAILKNQNEDDANLGMLIAGHHNAAMTMSLLELLGHLSTEDCVEVLSQKDKHQNTLGMFLAMHGDSATVMSFFNLLKSLSLSERFKIFMQQKDGYSLCQFIARFQNRDDAVPQCFHELLKDFSSEQLLVVLSHKSKKGWSLSQIYAYYQSLTNMVSLLKLTEKLSASQVLLLLKSELNDKGNITEQIKRYSPANYQAYMQYILSLCRKSDTARQTDMLDFGQVARFSMGICAAQEGVLEENISKLLVEIANDDIRNQLLLSMLKNAGTTANGLNYESLRNHIQLLCRLKDRYGFNFDQAQAWSKHRLQLSTLIVPPKKTGRITGFGVKYQLPYEILITIVSKLTNFSWEEADRLIAIVARLKSVKDEINRCNDRLYSQLSGWQPLVNEKTQEEFQKQVIQLVEQSKLPGIEIKQAAYRHAAETPTAKYQAIISKVWNGPARCELFFRRLAQEECKASSITESSGESPACSRQHQR
ncbi:MAG: hypothetical protein K0S08_1545 [Gammaproteobacteria bacterium]|jgi:hypothetical protein|nr:hypothetical protein [Gammaproteobacteria bacterium]